MGIAVLGAGGWGTALTVLLAEKYTDVVLWGRNPLVIKNIAEQRVNQEYLPGIFLPTNVQITSDIQRAVSKKDILVLATPSHGIRELILQIRPLINNNMIIVSVAKGFELQSLSRVSEVIANDGKIPPSRIAVLSGPNHAEEVGVGYPSASVAACLDIETSQKVQQIFMTSKFRVYTSQDVCGVELGGALKNIIALGAGIVEGLQYGDNTKAALITRGLAEMIRLGSALGANPFTFSGLSGIGDLIATCTGKHSRNRKAGVKIGQGQTADEICRSTNMVVEGIRATKAAYMIAQEHKVSMPITEQLYNILYQNKSPNIALEELMSRGGTYEDELAFS